MYDRSCCRAVERRGLQVVSDHDCLCFYCIFEVLRWSECSVRSIAPASDVYGNDNWCMLIKCPEVLLA